MTSDAASSEPAVDLADQSVSPIDKVWTDAFWATIVGSVDGLLRAYYGIHDFTDDPDCIFRTALCRARHPIGLCDGTQIRRGEIVGALHWWNEHLRRYSGHGPDIAWAGDMRRRIRRSLHLLADHIVRDPAWRPIEAFRADATLSSRLGSGQIRRVAERYGFEVVEPEPSIILRVQALGASFNSWALTRAFNPSALPRQRFLRGRHELWISRATLLRNYQHDAGRQLHRAA